MIDFDTAKNMFEQWMHEAEIESGIELKLHSIQTEDFGWIFFYNSKEFLENNNTSYALGGNCPILIEAATGEMLYIPTNDATENFIQEYIQKNGNVPWR